MYLNIKELYRAIRTLSDFEAYEQQEYSYSLRGLWSRQAQHNLNENYSNIKKLCADFILAGKYEVLYLQYRSTVSASAVLPSAS